MLLKRYKYILILVIFLLAGGYLLATGDASAALVDELKNKITERNNSLGELQEEIDAYQEELDGLGKQKKTLGNELYKLNLRGKKLNKDIKYTQNKIGATGLNIEKLFLEISLKAKDIDHKKEILAETIRRINEFESQSLMEITLANDNFSDFFNDLERLEGLQNGIALYMEELRVLKIKMEEQRKEKKKEKKNLETMDIKLKDQEIIVGLNKKDKNRLLKDTKNKESNYNNLLEATLKKREKLEREIADFEDQLRVEIDPNSLPSVGSGVLRWPLAGASDKSCYNSGQPAKNCVTQYFGNTTFSKRNAGVYNGAGHNGIDFRASMGTPVLAAKSGTVVDVGDTDATCKGVSYGKWVLIKYPNNFTNLYAHLSLIKVSKGEKVTVGQTIAYSGNSGYSTGPHLHFTLFASPAVRVIDYTSKVCGTKMKLPMADKKWYLNPLLYL